MRGEAGIVSTESVAPRILVVRGQRVLLSTHLAALYGVEVRALVQAVKRNAARFPADFMFQLTAHEFAALKSQIVISRGHGGLRRATPYAFTEQGVAMLSSVLRSERAVRVNIAIMRAFVKLRETLETNRALARKFAELEDRVGKHDRQLNAILDVIRQLMSPPARPARKIGFHGQDETGGQSRARKG